MKFKLQPIFRAISYTNKRVNASFSSFFQKYWERSSEQFIKNEVL